MRVLEPFLASGITLLRKITKIVFALAGTMLALTLVVVLSLGVWVMTGPKSLTKLLPYIEASLNPPESPYDVRIEDAVIFWDGWSEPMDFRLRGVALSTEREGAQLLKLNEISVGLDIPSLMRFHIVPKSIVVRSPEMRFFREYDGAFYVGIGENASQRVPLSMLLGGMDNAEGDVSSNSLIGNIELIAIEHAQLSMGAPGQDALFDAQDANLRIRRENNAIIAEMNIAMKYGNRPSQISGQVRLTNQQEMMVAKVELLDISPHMFAKLLPETPEFATLELPLSGWADIAIDKGGNVTLVDYRLQSNAGTFTHKDYFAETLVITQSAFEGQIRDNFKQFVVKKAELHFGDAKLVANGIAQQHPKGWSYDGIAVATNMPVNDLYKYWPQGIASSAYQWVTTHIREGVVPKAEARFKRTSEQLEGPMPESALDVDIAATGVRVEYLPGHPKVHNVDGTIKFTGKGMTISSKKGAMLSGGVLKKAWLEIPDLTAKPAPMHIALDIQAPAQDVATYIDIPSLGFAKPLGLDPATIQGQADASMKFDFVLHPKEHKGEDPQLSFLIDANIADGAQKGFMGDMNLTSADGKLTITQNTLDFNGTMGISNAPLNIALTHYFTPKEYQTEYHVNGVLAVPQLTAFSLPELPFLQGNVGVDVRILRKTGMQNIKGIADATQVAADIPEIGLTKKAGSKALIQFEADMAAGALALKSFVLAGDELRTKGSAAIGDNMSSLKSLRFEQLEYGDNNLAMTIEEQGAGYKIRAKGPSLDLKPLFAEEEVTALPEPTMPQEEKKLPFPIDFHGEFDWIVIGKERELRKVNAIANCTPDICEAVDVRGVTGQSNGFIYQIKRIDGARELNFTAQNAGSFLKAMDIYDNMHGGELSVRGRFNDAVAKHPFSGTLYVSEHRITNAPVLAKMASLLSLTGIGDALSGKGITFRRIDSDIGYVDGVLSLSNGKAYGPALGITVENGTLDTDRKTIAMTGTVVPSYTLNTVLDNIPVIGEVLTGGKGEGVFAATYEISGKYPDDAQVSVNPLTMLAPGFLRNVFGGGSEKPLVKEQPAAATPPSQ